MRVPSGEICGLALTGFPNKTLLGISSTLVESVMHIAPISNFAWIVCDMQCTTSIRGRYSVGAGAVWGWEGALVAARGALLRADLVLERPIPPTRAATRAPTKLCPFPGAPCGRPPWCYCLP